MYYDSNLDSMSGNFTNEYLDFVTVILFDSSFTTVGSSVFRGYSNLVSVIALNSNICFDTYAFYDCNKINSITTRDKVLKKRK